MTIICTDFSNSLWRSRFNDNDIKTEAQLLAKDPKKVCRRQTPKTKTQQVKKYSHVI